MADCHECGEVLPAGLPARCRSCGEAMCDKCHQITGGQCDGCRDQIDGFKSGLQNPPGSDML